MPRKLPWQTSSSTTVAKPKRALASNTAPKRQKDGTKDASDSEEDVVGPTAKKARANREQPQQQPASSPPPDPPEEDFMVEGMDDDDKYRMVEDEFLTIAQRFTVHLHAAEYKRQQKMAKTRNAETISDISRPVTGKMPDQTKRKVEAVARAKAQKSILEGLVGKNVEDLSDDSDDGGGLPYVGTSLHGLMDSPRRKATSLREVSAAVTTRAAAGYKQPAQARRKSLGSPQPCRTAVIPRKPMIVDDQATDSSADDDDLDAAPRLEPVERKLLLTKKPTLVPGKTESKASELQPLPADSKQRTKHAAIGLKDVTQTIKKEIPSPPKIRNRVSRVERARERRIKEEQEQQAKAKLDIIPSFL